MQAADDAVEVEPGLFLGTRFSALLGALRERGITAVVNYAGELYALRQTYPADGEIETLQHWWEDLEHDILFPALADGYAFIRRNLDAGNRVLVHCAQGISRSPCQVLYYLMRTRHWTYDRALTHLAARVPRARPNPAYARQLAQYASESEW